MLPCGRFNILFSSLTNLKKQQDLGKISSGRKERILRFKLCCNREEGSAGFWQNAENEERRAVAEGEQPFAMCHHSPEGKKPNPSMANLRPRVYPDLQASCSLVECSKSFGFAVVTRTRLFCRRSEPTPSTEARGNLLLLLLFPRF